MKRKKDPVQLISSPLPEKALELLLILQNLQTQPHPIYLLIAPTSWRQNLLELCSKLLEKGSQNLVQLLLSQMLQQRKRGAMPSLPRINENFVLELQGAV
jgi:hypothetical protein